MFRERIWINECLNESVFEVAIKGFESKELPHVELWFQMDAMHFELHFNWVGMHFEGKIVDFVMKMASFCWHMVDFVGIWLILRSLILIRLRLEYFYTHTRACSHSNDRKKTSWYFYDLTGNFYRTNPQSVYNFFYLTPTMIPILCFFFIISVYFAKNISSHRPWYWNKWFIAFMSILSIGFIHMWNDQSYRNGSKL